MRTRTRSVSSRTIDTPAATVQVSYVRCDGVGVGTNPYNRASHISVAAGRDERIADMVGRGKSHPCYHRVFDFDFESSLTHGSFADIPGGAHAVASFSMPHLWYPEHRSMMGTQLGWDVMSNTSLPPNWILTGTIDESAAVNNILQQARQLKADVLLNLVEANQIWPSIRSLATALPNMAANWLKIRKLIRTASGSFLAWKFGISPILSDINAVQRYLPKLASDLQRHRDGDAKRFSMVFPANLSYIGGSYLSGGQNGFKVYDYTRQGRSNASSSVRYVLVVEPAVRYLTSFFSNVDGLARRFSTSPASLAWELVPFSFVVDWFVDLRGALNTLDNIVGVAPYKVRSFTRSFGYDVSADVFMDTFSPCNGSPTFSCRLGSASYRHYERSMVSGGNLATWNPRFGKSQAAISAALISQSLSRLR